MYTVLPHHAFLSDDFWVYLSLHSIKFILCFTCNVNIKDTGLLRTNVHHQQRVRVRTAACQSRQCCSRLWWLHICTIAGDGSRQQNLSSKKIKVAHSRSASNSWTIYRLNQGWLHILQAKFTLFSTLCKHCLLALTGALCGIIHSAEKRTQPNSHYNAD